VCVGEVGGGCLLLYREVFLGCFGSVALGLGWVDLDIFRKDGHFRYQDGRSCIYSIVFFLGILL